MNQRGISVGINALIIVIMALLALLVLAGYFLEGFTSAGKGMGNITEGIAGSASEDETKIGAETAKRWGPAEALYYCCGSKRWSAADNACQRSYWSKSDCHKHTESHCSASFDESKQNSDYCGAGYNCNAWCIEKGYSRGTMETCTTNPKTPCTGTGINIRCHCYE